MKKVLSTFFEFALGIFLYLFYLKRFNSYSEDQLKTRGLQRFRATLLKAMKESEYYGIQLEPFKNEIEDSAADKLPGVIEKIPILKKQDVRKNFHSIKSRKRYFFTKLYRTSGSTGEPLEYIKSAVNLAWEYAYHILYFSSSGAGFKHKMAVLRTYVPDSAENFSKKDLIFPILWLSAYHMRPDVVLRYVEKLREFNGEYIRGYPSSLYILAKYCLDHDINDLKFAGAFSSSETLPKENRNVIEQAFGCKVSEYYGLSENVISCYQCKEGDLYHINYDYGYFEVLKPDGTQAQKGEKGVIVGTGFNNSVFPFIRYWTGDVCKIADRNCLCGKEGTFIEYIEGRLDDILLGEGGTPLPGVNFYSLFREFGSIDNFQIIQSSPTNFEVSLIVNSDFTPDTEKEIEIELRKRIGNAQQISYKYVDDLQKNSIGKVRSLIRKFEYEFELA